MPDQRQALLNELERPGSRPPMRLNRARASAKQNAIRWITGQIGRKQTEWLDAPGDGSQVRRQQVCRAANGAVKQLKTAFDVAIAHLAQIGTQDSSHGPGGVLVTKRKRPVPAPASLKDIKWRRDRALPRPDSVGISRKEVPASRGSSGGTPPMPPVWESSQLNDLKEWRQMGLAAMRFECLIQAGDARKIFTAKAKKHLRLPIEERPIDCPTLIKRTNSTLQC